MINNTINSWLMIICLLLLAGCQSKTNILTTTELSQLTFQQIMLFNQQTCQRQDNQQIIVKASDPLHTRLSAINVIFPTMFNGQALNYQIYRNIQPNAWSSLNGCIRINEGVFDALNDNEIQAVIAHEIGHIALNHSIDAFHQAKSAEISQYGDITLWVPQSLILAQEIDADNYAIAFFKSQQLDLEHILSALNKLAKYQKQHSDNHPDSQTRLENILNQLSEDN